MIKYNQKEIKALTPTHVASVTGVRACIDGLKCPWNDPKHLSLCQGLVVAAGLPVHVTYSVIAKSLVERIEFEFDTYVETAGTKTIKVILECDYINRPSCPCFSVTREGRATRVLGAAPCNLLVEVVATAFPYAADFLSHDFMALPNPASAFAKLIPGLIRDFGIAKGRDSNNAIVQVLESRIANEHNRLTESLANYLRSAKHEMVKNYSHNF